MERALFCVCYLPSATTSRGDHSSEFFNILKQQILQYKSLGPIVICGDFNACCGHTIDIPDANPLSLTVRSICDLNTNSQGLSFIHFLEETDFCTFNGDLVLLLISTCTEDQQQ